jgi:hypothetical protein
LKKTRKEFDLVALVVSFQEGWVVETRERNMEANKGVSLADPKGIYMEVLMAVLTAIYSVALMWFYLASQMVLCCVLMKGL